MLFLVAKMSLEKESFDMIMELKENNIHLKNIIFSTILLE